MDSGNCSVENENDSSQKMHKVKRTVINKRKNIRGILDTSQLNQVTLDAQKREFERILRMKEQQKMIEFDNTHFGSYSNCPQSNQISSVPVTKVVETELIVLSSDEEDSPEQDYILLSSDSECDDIEVRPLNNSQDYGIHTDDTLNTCDAEGRVLVNVGHPADEPDIFLLPQFSNVIKPHQIGGVRFLYDNIIENLRYFDKSPGLGCILAHSMGLGKTLQVICFTDIFLRYTNSHKILCIMPVNTLQNWMAEYDMWLPENSIATNGVEPRRFKVFVMNDSNKTIVSKMNLVQDWNKFGGVLLMGYELFRLLASKKNASLKQKHLKVVSGDEMQMINEFYRSLLDPGADLVICDEGHRIKNSHTSISKVLMQIRTRRRIVLTGYPLQNNLLEYWCMVDFVRPSYLGSKSEFSNMFEQPIKNGQCVDSTAKDIELMRYRAHVLHELLKKFVQRRSHAVLTSTLPMKQEYVLLLRMTTLQRSLYNRFMNEVLRSNIVANPIKAYTVCCKIWNHPDVLYNFLQKQSNEEFIDLDLEEVTNRIKENNDVKLPTTKNNTNKISYAWAHEMMQDYKYGLVANSAKMMIFYTILGECLRVGDRMLLFSQSLLTLDLIEDYLKRVEIDNNGRTWLKNRDYFRLDGSTNALEREKLINDFNRNPNVHLFLMSTRAGCLGINLIGANRVIIFDTSWNPCHDSQAVCRIYRYGQQKPCYIYRLVMDCCLEKKIYDRQINKQGLSNRVLDECNPAAHLSSYQMMNLYYDDGVEPEPCDYRSLMYTFNDNAIDMVLSQYSELLTHQPFKHDSLLANKNEQELTRAEKNLAEKNYQLEKDAVRGVGNSVGSELNYNYKPTVTYNTKLNKLTLLEDNHNTMPQIPSQMHRFIHPPEFWHLQNVSTREIVLSRDLPVIAGHGQLELLQAGQHVMLLCSSKGIFFQLESGRIVPLPQNYQLQPSDYIGIGPQIPPTMPIVKNCHETIVINDD